MLLEEEREVESWKLKVKAGKVKKFVVTGESTGR